MAFTTNLSGTAQVDDSIVTLYDQAFITEVAQNDVMDPFITVIKRINAATVKFPRYTQLAIPAASLTETDDVTSEAIADTGIILTPVEEGNVVTKTELASLQTGGVIDLVIPQLVGMNAAATSNLRATNALLASSNVLTPGGVALASLAATDVLSGTFLNKLYNKLSRKGNGIATIVGSYVLFAHDDVIADLRADTAVGSWVDVSKYSLPGQVFANEVGMYKGFRIIRNNALVGVDQAGAGTVDVYPIIALGFNGLGKAVSREVEMRATGPFDKLARFVNMGWYGVYKYGIVEADAVWVGYVASSLGNNAA